MLMQCAFHDSERHTRYNQRHLLPHHFERQPRNSPIGEFTLSKHRCQYRQHIILHERSGQHIVAELFRAGFQLLQQFLPGKGNRTLPVCEPPLLLMQQQACSFMDIKQIGAAGSNRSLKLIATVCNLTCRSLISCLQLIVVFDQRLEHRGFQPAQPGICRIQQNKAESAEQ
ncbi:hypothetical protein D3C87_1480210 [compost metagenome]